MTPKAKSRSSRIVKAIVYQFKAIAYQYQIGAILAGFRMHGKNLTANIDKYYQEANAVKIPGGKFLGAAERCYYLNEV